MNKFNQIKKSETTWKACIDLALKQKEWNGAFAHVLCQFE